MANVKVSRPRWAKNAIATPLGWVDPKNGRILKRIKLKVVPPTQKPVEAKEVPVKATPAPTTTETKKSSKKSALTSAPKVTPVVETKKSEAVVEPKVEPIVEPKAEPIKETASEDKK